MKANIHPDYHTITVKMTDGFTYETRSTWGKQGDVLQLDVDTKTHPAWVGGTQLRKTGQMEKFNNKFAFLETKSNEQKAPEAKAEVKPDVKADAKAEAKMEAKADAKPAEKAAKKKEDKKS